MARPSNKALRRKQIAEALGSVLATEGYDGATIAAIAAEAGLTPGLVHYHFGSKQEILLHMIDLLLQKYRESLSQALSDAGDDPGARLAAFLDAHLAVGAHADAEAMAAWVILGGESLRQPEVRVAYAEALEGIAASLRVILDDGIAAGAFDCPDPDAACAALVSLIQGYFLIAMVHRSLIPRGSAATAARRMALGLVGWTPETPHPPKEAPT